MLEQIKKTLDRLEADGEKPDLSVARYELLKARAMLEDLVVRGRDNVDMLYGCMLAFDKIIGEEDDNG